MGVRECGGYNITLHLLGECHLLVPFTRNGMEEAVLHQSEKIFRGSLEPTHGARGPPTGRPRQGTATIVGSRSCFHGARCPWLSSAFGRSISPPSLSPGDRLLQLCGGPVRKRKGLYSWQKTQLCSHHHV